MKEKLIKRLEDMNKLIHQKRTELHQMNADFNTLVGQQTELSGLLNSWDELSKVEQDLELLKTG